MRWPAPPCWPRWAQLQADLQSFVWPRHPAAAVLLQTAPQQCRYYRLLLAIEAGRGAAGRAGCPDAAGGLPGQLLDPGLPSSCCRCSSITALPSGSFTAAGTVDAPVELHLPDERQPALGLTLPVRTTPSPGYQLW